MRQLTYITAMREALQEEMKRDQSVFLMAESSMTMGQVRRGLAEEFGRDRVRSTPVVESAIIGAAIGAAITGMRPIAEIMSIDWTTCCMDQIANQLAKIRYMTGAGVKVPVVVTTLGGSGGALGGSGGAVYLAAQHEQSLEALFTHIPGLMVVMPSTPYDAKGLLKSSIRDDNPVIFIGHKGLSREKEPVPEEEYLLPLGQAEVKREGRDITVVAWSRSVLQALKAAKVLEEHRISLEVIDPRTLRPLDEDTILNSVKKTGKLIIVHEACKTGGFGGEIAAIVAEKAFHYLNAPIKRVASLDSPIPYSPELAARVFCNEHDIMVAAAELMGKPIPER